MRKFPIIFVGFTLLCCSFWWSESRLFYVPEGWPAPSYDFTKNPMTPEIVLLGRALFHDPILSRDNTISCTSCHSQYSAFTHTDHDLSHGIEDRIGIRNSPALMNLAWQENFMWDGSVHHLDMQSLAPISNPLEMDSSIEEVVGKLRKSRIYPTLFREAFGDSIPTGARTLKALAQFMLTFVSADAKYDQVQRGTAEFTVQEANGYQLFKQHCAACHQEPLFTSGEFANNGLAIDTTLNDLGRATITKKSSDHLKFKIPTLRNVQFSHPYMHDGRFKKLSDVLDHYDRGIVTSATLAPALKNRIPLTSNEQVDVLAFLMTLTDKAFLFNRDFGYPRAVLLGE